MSYNHPSEGAWERLSQVAVKGAEYNSRERQPHPKCMERTRVNLLGHIYQSLDDGEGSRIVWIHGTAGVGKSAVAFTVADRMKGLKATEKTSVEKRLAGTFFFSRNYVNRRMTGYFFATLVYQLARNFPSIREDVSTSIRENPSLLDPDYPLDDQMDTLFLKPLRRLQLRLKGCPPVVFVVDALDECASTEIADLISLLGQALRERDLPVIHILLTSRSEAHIREAMNEEKVRSLVREVPVKTSGKDVISLDGADVDSDICIFLDDSFKKLRHRCPAFRHLTPDELKRLAIRAGRRFIVASTMMKFIDDGYNDPHDRLELMLNLTSELLPGTEVYKLYDHILLTCSDPKRAYRHLSIVTTLANPLPISQISELLGPGEGRDVEIVLVQLRSLMDIPTDSNLPLSIHHSSVRDYVSNPSNCDPQVQCTTPPHTILADSSFRLMIRNLPKSSGLLDALLELKTQSRAMESHEPESLRQSLAFIVQPPTVLAVLTTLLWLRGDRSPPLHSWLKTLEGGAWLCTQGGRDWLQSPNGWGWVQSPNGWVWLNSQDGLDWMESPNRRDWLESLNGRDWLRSTSGRDWLQSLSGRNWLMSPSGSDWLWLRNGRNWLVSPSEGDWLELPNESDWLESPSGTDWLESPSESNWLRSPNARDWLQTPSGTNWLQSTSGSDWLQSPNGSNWLQSPGGSNWLQSPSGSNWLQSPGGSVWLQSTSGWNWLQSTSGWNWLESPSGRDWLESPSRCNWLESPSRSNWRESPISWDWLESLSGSDWLQSQRGSDWLQSQRGNDWLQSQRGRDWLQSPMGSNWLQTGAGREWLQTKGGRGWLGTSSGRAWRSTPAASFWVQMEEFLNMVEAINNFMIIPELSSLQAFQAIQQFKSLPDFLMFPAFLTLTHRISTSQLDGPDIAVIHAIIAFASFTNEARERSRSAPGALTYACQHWAMHLSCSPKPWDNTLNHIFKAFWDRYLPSWLERQWCSRGLQSCLIVLTEGQKLTKSHNLIVDTRARIGS